MESAATPHKSELRRTPLNALHRRLGAKMVNFGGWDMPVEYPSSGGLIAEHKAVRASVGVFDVSHMGDIRIRSGGKPGGALAAVQHITMNDASRLAIGQAHYSAMLYPEGTFVDDVIVHRLGEDDFLLVINAGTREKDINWVRDNTKGFDGAVEDLSDAYTQCAIQGPGAGKRVASDAKMAPAVHDTREQVVSDEDGVERKRAMDSSRAIGPAELNRAQRAGMARTPVDVGMMASRNPRREYWSTNAVREH